MADRDWTAVFSEEFGQPESRVQAEIWAEVLGDEYPAEVAPYSYTTRSELRRIAAEVQVGDGDQLVDVGSGRGGPGLWVAATTGADYCAVDIATPGLEQVRARAERLGLAGRVRTLVGSFEQLPLPDASADAVMSIDALLFTPDKQAAVNELARVIGPGGRLVLTSWDYSRRPVGRPPQVADHRPVLESAGFRVLAYEETPDWESRHRAIDRLLLARVDELAAEAGEDPESLREGLTEMAATVEAMLRRVLVVAERTGG